MSVKPIIIMKIYLIIIIIMMMVLITSRCESVSALKPGIDRHNCPLISVGSIGLVR